MVIGGAEIYERALPMATRIELTEVHKDFDGDARFEFDRTGWHETARERPCHARMVCATATSR